MLRKPSEWHDESNTDATVSNGSDTVRQQNVGNSDYSKHSIQPWDIWKEYRPNPWRADIIKRILRNKSDADTRLDFEKIKHICDECIRQIDAGEYYP